MTKVTLFGGAIRLIGYGNAVPELLSKEFDVFQPADTRGRICKQYVKNCGYYDCALRKGDFCVCY